MSSTFGNFWPKSHLPHWESLFFFIDWDKMIKNSSTYSKGIDKGTVCRNMFPHLVKMWSSNICSLSHWSKDSPCPTSFQLSFLLKPHVCYIKKTTFITFYSKLTFNSHTACNPANNAIPLCLGLISTRLWPVGDMTLLLDSWFLVFDAICF